MFGNAKFIKARGYDKEFSLFAPLPVFRRDFTLRGEIKNAVITVVSPGFACYYINGKPVTDDLFISPTSNYNKLMWYNRYEVTDLLCEGVNTVSVIAGNGFFNEPFITAWDYQDSSWRDAPQFMFSLCIDGQETLVSDESWRYSTDDSPVIYSHIRSGEHYDARKGEAWRQPNFDITAWKSVETKEIPAGVTFMETPCEPVREIEEIKPVKIIKNDRGYLVDFGLNTAGYISLRLCEKAGTEILLRHSEEIDENNHPKYAYIFYHESVSDDEMGRYNMAQTRFYPQSPFHLNKIIASGECDEVKPRFCYHGFRFVEIEGLTKEPKKEDITAYFISQKVKRTANFECGNEVLNFIYTAGIRSTKSNMFWSLTDCPTREKLGWTNDAASSAEQVLINFDIKRLLEKWFTDLKQDMRDDGSLPGIIPSNGWGDDWGPVCDNFLFEIPYRTYLYTGDDKMLVGAIPYFERYVQFLTKKREENHEFILGDWLGYDSSPLTPKEFVRDFYLIKALRVTEIAYKLKGEKADKLSAQLSELERDFISRYNGADGNSIVDSQTALSMLICFNLCKDERKVKKQLVERVEKDGFMLTAGMVGVQYLYDALSLSGKPDYAFKLLTQSEPGYKTWLNAGATTLWECWDGIEKGSHNHHMFSGVIAWLYKSLLGIRVSESKPAYEQIELSPCFIADVGYAKGEIETPYGTLSAEWHYDGVGFKYEVTVPYGITAYYDGRKLDESKNEFYVKN